jgi:flagellar motor switch protein FliN/FliY
MTEGVESVTPAEAQARAFAEVWAGSMAQVLGQIAGNSFPVECLDAAPPEAVPPAESDVNIIATAAGSLRGEMSLRFPRNVALSLAQILLGETPDPAAEFKSDHKDAAEELFRQIAGHIVTAAKERWGEVQLSIQSGPVPTWAAGAVGWIASGTESSVRVWLEWQISAALCAELRPDASQAAAASAPQLESPEPQLDTILDDPVPPGKLGLFMDVELEITLRFGGRRMLLREILELAPGSVVELDRQVQEPVDLILDGRLIARGEVVVVDGNYGVRILDVVSTQLPGQFAQA